MEGVGESVVILQSVLATGDSRAAKLPMCFFEGNLMDGNQRICEGNTVVSCLYSTHFFQHFIWNFHVFSCSWRLVWYHMHFIHQDSRKQKHQRHLSKTNFNKRSKIEPFQELRNLGLVLLFWCTSQLLSTVLGARAVQRPAHGKDWGGQKGGDWLGILETFQTNKWKLLKKLRRSTQSDRHLMLEKLRRCLSYHSKVIFLHRRWWFDVGQDGKMPPPRSLY